MRTPHFSEAPEGGGVRVTNLISRPNWAQIHVPACSPNLAPDPIPSALYPIFLVKRREIFS